MPGVAEYNQPFMGAIPTAAQPTYPVQNGSTQAAGSSGGLVNQAAQIQSGVQNGLNMVNQGQQMNRAQTEFNEQQARTKANGNLGKPDDPADNTNADGSQASGNGHMDFLHSLANSPAGKAVMAGVHAIGNMVSGGGSAIPAPAVAQQGPPAPTLAPAPQGPPAPAAMMNGGVVGTTSIGNMGVNPQFQRGAATVSPDILAMQSGGAIPAMGVVAGATDGIPGYEAGGAISGGLVNQAAQIQSGAQNGLNMAAQGQQMDNSQTLFDQHQVADHAQGDVGTPASPEHAQAEATRAIDEAHQILHDHTLNDADVPNNAQAIPAAPAAGAASAPNAPGPQSQATTPGTPPQASAGQASAPNVDGSDGSPSNPQQAAATASAVQNTAQNPAAQSGDPGPTTRPHSITPEQWDAYDRRKEYAIKMAAYAGQDPGQVRAAMDANRNAWVQGGVLRYLSAANVSLQNGDQKGVETALKNAYYYMPDGRDLTIQKDKQGNLMYQDPISPTIKGADGKTVPNMIPVDAAHIQLLGQAMLDPMNVQTTISNLRTAKATMDLKGAEAERDRQQGVAAGVTAQGALLKGQGISDEGRAHMLRVNSQNYKDLAEGDAARVRATAIANHLNNLVHQNKLDPTLLKGAQDASDGFEKAVQGQLTTIQGDPMTNPNVGKPTRDPTKSILPNATPMDVASGRAIAADIYSGSGGTKSPAEAIRLAALAVQAKKSTSPKSPGEKPSPDFMTDSKTGDTHVWNKATKKWEAFKLPLASAAAAASGNVGISEDELDDVTKAELANNGGGGQSAIPTSSPQMQAAQTGPEDAAPDNGPSTANES